MTGFGDARGEDSRLHVTAEARTVNNRYLKVAVRCPDAYGALESRIEKLVRETVARGTVTVLLRVQQLGARRNYSVNPEILENYWRQIHTVATKLQTPQMDHLGWLLSLPGAIVNETPQDVDIEADWPLIQSVVSEAINKLQTFRQEEGRSILVDLQKQAALIEEHVATVPEIAPQVVEEYRQKVHERLQQVLHDHGVTLEPSDLVREVGIYADRCDINEEITRLRCHLEQFEAFLIEPESMGRKLDFLSQEIVREVNTIGSKANNVAIAHRVVDMKTAVEKIRENLQNVE